MFTGIIQELGRVSQIKTVGDSLQLNITAKNILKNISLGDSIAVNGVCLTVTTFDADSCTFDVMPETFRATSLAKLTLQSLVNLEPALAVGGKLGGHFVTGHVDGIGEIVKIEKNNNAVNYQIKLPQELLRYCLLKGSIAVDGTSLTIFALDDVSIGLSLIPHTIKNSVLGMKKVGDIVNIECDMLGKYVVDLMSKNSLLQGQARQSMFTSECGKDGTLPTNINFDLLKQQGFM